MDKISKKEFCQRAGIVHATLSMAIKRGHVVTTSDNKIDVSLEINNDFLTKKRDIRNKKDINKKEQDELPQSDITLTATSKYELETLLKKFDIKKRIEEVELLKIKKEKLKGELIDLAIAKIVIHELSKSILISQKNLIENTIVSISKEVSLDAAQIARLRTKLIDELNLSSAKASIAAKKRLQSIVSEMGLKEIEDE